MEQAPLTITTADGQSHDFTVELALTADQQQRGMMGRQSLAPDEGMLFVYDTPDYRSFWMKNTYIPLDIIFIDGNGKILSIEENTVPLSLEPSLSLEPALLVLELAGGRSAELGIQPGDTVTWER
ncbi:DUF192 domain-containing protein [Sphingomicrobium clamense]|uniref:DUF192 domain-containing protein n=1 Tax=Sphingomicrobium clamense TaxID=2851013 RepID=A0ABS6V4U6_9SPHN|nr:DUF192 domain-containing protein [Sphingomicrobium sp. B8]MBW0144564.1 DUF192 domain-containing protein [Sphingomicrobium sp. B8]